MKTDKLFDNLYVTSLALILEVVIFISIFLLIYSIKDIGINIDHITSIVLSLFIYVITCVLYITKLSKKIKKNKNRSDGKDELFNNVVFDGDLLTNRIFNSLFLLSSYIPMSALVSISKSEISDAVQYIMVTASGVAMLALMLILVMVYVIPTDGVLTVFKFAYYCIFMLSILILIVNKSDYKGKTYKELISDSNIFLITIAVLTTIVSVSLFIFDKTLKKKDYTSISILSYVVASICIIYAGIKNKDYLSKYLPIKDTDISSFLNSKNLLIGLVGFIGAGIIITLLGAVAVLFIVFALLAFISYGSFKGVKDSFNTLSSFSNEQKLYIMSFVAISILTAFIINSFIGYKYAVSFVIVLVTFVTMYIYSKHYIPNNEKNLEKLMNRHKIKLGHGGASGGGGSGSRGLKSERELKEGGTFRSGESREGSLNRPPLSRKGSLNRLPLSEKNKAVERGTELSEKNKAVQRGLEYWSGGIGGGGGGGGSRKEQREISLNRVPSKSTINNPLLQGKV